ncbi:MAG: hypothetical protein ACRDPY_15185 [Streptosporangiaceae bacterium]
MRAARLGGGRSPVPVEARCWGLPGTLAARVRGVTRAASTESVQATGPGGTRKERQMSEAQEETTVPDDEEADATEGDDEE